MVINTSTEYLNKPLVSVVIPAYNIQDFLPMCIESVCHQTYSNLEVILVNDGSTDNSGKICHKYQSRDPRIKYFKKMNGGLSSARNYGAEKATGDLLVFVDGDDLISPDCIELLTSAYQDGKAQLAIGIAERIPEKQDYLASKESHEIEISPQKTVIDHVLYGTPGVSRWCKLASRKFWQENPLPEGCAYEDLRTTFGILAQCQTIAIVWGPIYGYRFRAGSITSKKTITRKQLDDYIIAIQSMDRDLAKININPNSDSYVCRHCNEFARVYRFLEQHKKESPRYKQFSQSIVTYERKHFSQLLRMHKANRTIKSRSILLAIAPWMNTFAYSLATRLIGKSLS